MMNTTINSETTDKPFKDELVLQKLGIYLNSSRLKEILSHVGEIIATVDGDASMNELIVLDDGMMSLFIVNRVIKEFTQSLQKSMSFNSHRRNKSLLMNNRKSIPNGNRSLRKVNQPAIQNLPLVMAKQYYYKYNNMEAAINNFQEFLQLNPKNLQALYLCAIAYLHQQKPQSAIAKLHEYILIKKSTSQVKKLIISKQQTSLNNAWLLLSMAYCKVNNLNKALEMVNQSIKTESRFEDAYCYRAKIYIKMGEHGKAENDYKTAIRLNHKSWMAYNGLADCYRARFQYEMAIKYYDKVIQFIKSQSISVNQEYLFIKNEPNILQTQLKKCICQYQNESYEESLKGLNRLRERKKSSEIYYYIALNQLKLNESVKKFNRTCSMHPKQKENVFISETPKIQQNQKKNVSHDEAILNLQYSIKAQTNVKISSKASKLLIKIYLENYQFYEAINIIELGNKLKIKLGEYKDLAQACMQVIKQKYKQALPILKKLQKKVSNKSDYNDSDTEKISPHPQNKRNTMFQKKAKKQRINLHRHYTQQKTSDEELLWMLPLILLFKAYCQFFLNNFIQSLQTYETYESHIKDYLGKDPEHDIYVVYNKVLCEGVLMLQNQLIDDSLQKFLQAIDNYYTIARGLPVQPVLFRILGMIRIALSENPMLNEEINSKPKIFLAILSVIDHYLPAIKKNHLVYYYKGLIMLSLKQYDQSSEELQTCLKLAEECQWKFLYVKGIAQLKKKSYHESIKQFSAGMILEQKAELFLGRCVSYLLLFHSSEKEPVLIQKAFEDLQKFIEFQTKKDKISIWVTKILFYNEAFQEAGKSVIKVEEDDEQIEEIRQYLNIYNGQFIDGGILGRILVNAFEGAYESNKLTIGNDKHEIREDNYITHGYRKWLKILHYYSQSNYPELLKLIQVSLFEEKAQSQIIELRYNLIITYMLLGEFSKADKVLALFSDSEIMKNRAQKMENKMYSQDECLPDLQDELDGHKRLSFYLPYKEVFLPDKKRIYVKISLPFPYFPKPNIQLDIDDEFLLNQASQECIPKRIEAPWIKKITGNIQFTENIVESEVSLLGDMDDDLSQLEDKIKSNISSSFSGLQTP